jgi:predicted glutamine amidotransferase
MNIQVAGESGVGTYMIVSTEVWTAKSTPVTGEWTDDTEKEAVDEIAMALSDNEANLLYAEYDSFVEARKNAEAEAAYRAEHPEEFETHSMDESDGIMSASIPEPQAE